MISLFSEASHVERKDGFFTNVRTGFHGALIIQNTAAPSLSHKAGRSNQWMEIGRRS